MHLTALEQSEIFRCAFLYGVFIGVFYDAFRLMRASGLDTKRAVFFQDIIFMSCASVLCFLFAQTTVHGHFRAFVMTGHLLGFAAYRASAGILTGLVFRPVGRVLRLSARFFNGLFLKLAAFIRLISVNLSRKIGKLHFSKPVNDKNEKNFQQI